MIHNSSPKKYHRQTGFSQGLRVAALVTLVAFTVNTVCRDYAYAARPTIDTVKFSEILDTANNVQRLFSISDFQLPEYLGEVKDRFDLPFSQKQESENKNEQRAIIHIQDAHCNYGAQHKIAGIVEYLNHTYGITEVNLEGGEGEYDLSIFTDVEDANIRGKVADSFVKDGELNGAEFYAIQNPDKVNLWGVEDPELYIKNLNVYRDVSEKKDTIDSLLKNLSYLLNNLKIHIFNKELIEFDTHREAFKNNNLDLKEYSYILAGLARCQSIELAGYPNIGLLFQTINIEKKIDFKEANRERERIIDVLQRNLSKTELEELVKKVVQFRFERLSSEDFYRYLVHKARCIGIDVEKFSNLRGYMSYVSVYDTIDKTILFEEMGSLEEKLKDALAVNPRQKKLLYLSKNFALIKAMLNIQLTKRDYEYYLQHRTDFDMQNFSSFIDKNSFRYKISTKLDENVAVLDGYIRQIEKFYEYSFKRDRAFLKNIRLNTAKQVTVLVTGGFHTENLCALMKQKNIPYVSIMPKFKNSDEYESPYFQLLGGEQSEEYKNVSQKLGISMIAIAGSNSILGRKVRAGEIDILRVITVMRIAREEGKQGIIVDGEYFDLDWNRIDPAKVESPKEFKKVSLSELAGSLRSNERTKRALPKISTKKRMQTSGKKEESAQMGKKVEIDETTIQLWNDGKEGSVKVCRPEDKQFSQTLIFEKEENINPVNKAKEALEYIEADSHKELMSNIINLFKKVPPKGVSRVELPQLYVFSKTIEDLFGFATYPTDKKSNIPKLIAVHEDFVVDPLAICHELFEYMMKSGALDLEFEGRTVKFLNKIYLGKITKMRLFRWFLKGEVVVKVYGKEIGGVVLKGEALSIAAKGMRDKAKKNHYLLRSLARTVFEKKDKYMTETIKSTRKPKRAESSLFEEMFSESMGELEDDTDGGLDTYDETMETKIKHEPVKHKSYDEILIEEIARKRGISIDDLESDFERVLNIEEARLCFKGFIIPAKDRIAQMLQATYDKLVAQVRKEDKDFTSKFYFTDDNAVNAFVFRKRTDVYFFKGLYETFVDIAHEMKKPLTEDMLAFIIAHELAHSMQHTSLQGLDIRDFQKDLPHYIIQMMKNGEYDADRKALELMDKAGYSVSGAIDALTYLEYITMRSQAETILSSHPYSTLRKHRLTQIIFEQSTDIFPNAKKEQKLVIEVAEIPSKDIDYKDLLNSSDEEIVTLAQGIKDFDQAKSLLLGFSTRKRMAIIKTLKNDIKLRHAFAKSIYLDAAMAALVSYGRRKSSDYPSKLPNPSIDYSDLRQAATVCEFGSVLDAYDSSKNLPSKFSPKTQQYFKDIHANLKDKDYNGRRYLSDEAVRFVWRHLKFIKKQYDNIDVSFLNGLLQDPESVREIIDLFRDPKKDIISELSTVGRKSSVIPDLNLVLSDPQRLVSAYLYGNYLGQSSSCLIKDPLTDLHFKVEENQDALYLKNPKYMDISSSVEREKILEILIAHYINKMPYSGDVLNSRFSRIENNYFGIKQCRVMPNKTIDEIFLALYRNLDEASPEILKPVIAKKLISRHLEMDLYTLELDNDVVEKILLSYLPKQHPATHGGEYLKYEVDEIIRSFCNAINDHKIKLLKAHVDYQIFADQLAQFIRENECWNELCKHEISREVSALVMQNITRILIPPSKELFTTFYLNNTRECFLIDVLIQKEKISPEDQKRTKMTKFLKQHPFFCALDKYITENNKRFSEKLINMFKEEKEKLLDLNVKVSLFEKLLHELFVIVYDAEPKRNPHTSEVFNRETGLNFDSESVSPNSFDELEALPAWCISDIVNKDGDKVKKIINNFLKENPEQIERVFEFMSKKLSFDDRKTFFRENFFSRGYSIDSATEYLVSFFNVKFKENYQEIILWFLGMFSKGDALTFLEKFTIKMYYHFKDQKKLSGQTDMLIHLFEYIYTQASGQFHPDDSNVKEYLALISKKYSLNDKRQDKRVVKETVFRTLVLLSGAVGLKLEVYRPQGVSPEGTNDYRTKYTSIKPKLDWGYRYPECEMKTKLSQHNFAWNDEGSQEQSPFVCFMVDFSIKELQELLLRRQRYVQDQGALEYAGEDFVRIKSEDFFARFIELILFNKLRVEDEAIAASEPIDQLNELGKIVKTSVRYEGRHILRGDKKINEIDVRVDSNLQHEHRDIEQIPVEEIIKTFVGYAIPSSFLDEIIEKYVKQNCLYDRFPDFVKLLQKPDDGSHYLNHAIKVLLKRTYANMVSYRVVMAQVLNVDSPYSRLFREYNNEKGEGVFYGKLFPLGKRMPRIKEVLPYKSILRDNAIDLWEAKIFPELMEDMPRLLRMLSAVKKEECAGDEMWSALQNIDDDVGKLQKIYRIRGLSKRRINRLLEFYCLVIPEILSPQRRRRYGVTAYLLWSRLEGNRQATCEEHVNALMNFMPEPNILRDEILTNIGNKHSRNFEDINIILPKLYANNILSPDRDLRSEDFISETIVSLFSTSDRRDRKQILLWVQGACEKPQFVRNVEYRYNISFNTLPKDMLQLPPSIRNKFIEAFMLGDNGLLDPATRAEGNLETEDEKVMAEYLQELFLHMFPEGSVGLDEEDRHLLANIFSIIMKSYYPYRRVHVIKTFAELQARSDFEKTTTGEKLAALLGALGPVGIKVAQYLSENETIVADAELRSRLGALRNKAPEVSKVSEFAVLFTETPEQGAHVMELGDPLGIASMKQVNRGKWLEGDGTIQNVVYKILRPNLEVSLESDYKALDAVAHELEDTVHKGHKINISDLVVTVKDWIEMERNFNYEVEFHHAISSLDYGYAQDRMEEAGLQIKHPHVFYHTKSLIVEEEIRGVALMDLAPHAQKISMDDVIYAGYSEPEAQREFKRLRYLDPRQARICLSLKKAGFHGEELVQATTKMLQYDYQSIVKLLRKVLLHQIFCDGIFHADLHQGNVMITPDGGLYMIDRGNVGKLNESQRQGAKDVLQGILLRDVMLIKQGIDRVFSSGGYQKGEGSAMSTITSKDIQEILNKDLNLKTTMHMIACKALKGGRNIQGVKDFSTFMKAFTQAMYLFSGDMDQGVATMRDISEYIVLTNEEMKEVIKSQAKFAVSEEQQRMQKIAEGSSSFRNKNIDDDIKSVVKKKTNNKFLYKLWQPVLIKSIILFFIISKPIGSAIAKKTRIYVQNNFEKILRFLLSELEGYQEEDVISLIKKYVDHEKLEYMFMESINRKTDQMFLKKILQPIIEIGAYLFLKMVRPITKFFVNVSLVWIETFGKKMISEVINSLRAQGGGDFLGALTREKEIPIVKEEQAMRSESQDENFGEPDEDGIKELLNKIEKPKGIDPDDEFLGNFIPTGNEIISSKIGVSQIGSSLIGKLFIDGECQKQIKENIIANEEGEGEGDNKKLVFYNVATREILYTRDGKEARVKLTSGIKEIDGQTIRIIKDNENIRGFGGAGGIQYLTRSLLDERVARYHEKQESYYADDPEKLPTVKVNGEQIKLNAHTFLRGCGKDVRKAYEILAARGENPDDVPVEKLIALLNKEMTGREVTKEEAMLIQHNIDRDRKGKARLYGRQDIEFGEEANERLTIKMRYKQLTQEDRVDEISKALTGVFGLVRFPEKKTIILMPRPKDEVLFGEVMKAWKWVRARSKDEYDMGNILVRFYNEKNRQNVLHKTQADLEKDADAFAMMYAREDIYDQITQDIEKFSVGTGQRMRCVKERIDDRELSLTMVGTHVILAQGLIDLVRNDYEHDENRRILIDSIANLLFYLTGGDEEVYRKFKAEPESIFERSFLLKIKPFSEELEQQLLAVEETARSL
ncbi:MAG: AarF/UbiB family protein [Candidatus Omnitrophota bacterium]